MGRVDWRGRVSGLARAIPGPDLSHILVEKNVSAGGDRGWMEGLMGNERKGKI